MQVRNRILLVLVAIAVSLGARMAFGGMVRAQSSAPHVEVGTINGVIDMFTEGYIERVMSVAQQDGASAVVFQLDTPGGNLDSTRKIDELFLDSSIPIIVYVSPSGARAGSAGTFITYGAHLAAMAPGTNIGAAHPVGANGEDITGTEGDKITNDSAALIRSLATQRGRNADWAEKSVRNSVSATEQEALQQGIINIVARDVPDLLNQADGKTVKVQNHDVTLQTRGATIRQVDMNFFEQFFRILLDPNVALVLLNIGTLAILAEVYHPGAVVPAVFGIICLTLAAVALYGLPTNWAAVILIVAGIVMMVLDIKVTGVALTVGGIIAFVLGAFFLFRPLTPPEPTAPDLSASPIVIGGLALLTLAFFLVVVGAAVRARSLPVITGLGPYLGAIGVARTRLNPRGTVLVRNEEWSALAQDPPIQEGEDIQVIAADGLTLQVRRTHPVPSR